MEIQLTHGFVAVIDDEDAELVAGRKWFAVPSRTPDRWYAATKIGNRRVWMHSMITGYEMTDHWDTNGLNNRRLNLRDCNDSQNCFNRRKRPGQTSQYKGVAWNRQKRKWTAQIRTKGRTTHLGVFVDEKEAARAYGVAALALAGEFARF
jgi:AP2 domain